MLHKPPLTHRNQHPAEFSLHERGCIKGGVHGLWEAEIVSVYERCAEIDLFYTRRTMMLELNTENRPNNEPQGTTGCLQTIIR